jgi:hypothetical protein
MSAYGIAGLVDGFIQGRNVRNSWQDRKDDKARQKRLDDLTFTQDGRAAEEHKRRMQVYDRNDSDWTRNRADDDAYRTAQNAAVDAALGVDAGQPDPQTITVSTSNSPVPMGVEDPVSGVAANLGMDLRQVPNRTGEAFERMLPAPESFGVPAATDGPASQAVAELGPSFEQSGRSAAARPTPAAANDQPPEPKFIRLPQPSPAISDELWRQGAIGAREVPNPKYVAPPDQTPKGKSVGLIDKAMGLYNTPVSEVEASLAADPNHEWGQGLPSDLKEVGKGAARAGINVLEKLDEGARSGSDLIGAGVGYITGNKVDKPKSATPNDMAKGNFPSLGVLSDDYQKAITPSKPTGPRVSNVPGSAAPVVKQAAAAATGAMAEVAAGSPAISEAAAAAASGKEGLGVKGADMHKPETRDRAAKSFMDRYREVGAPMVMEQMLRRGDIERAQKFQEFLDRGETKAGMDNWAKAAFAATVGDMDGFADNIMEAYNRMDYFPDGTQLVKEKSGFTYDKAGNILGAKLTFLDEVSGNTFEQTFASPDDLIQTGITLLAPENAFEYYMQKNEAEKAAALKALPDPRKAAEDEKKRIDATAKLIFEKTVDQLGAPTLTYEQARAQAEQIIRGGGPMPSGDGAPASTAPPPIAYRP